MMPEKDTKTRILEAAEELISQNGLENTTIASIARKAEVADSLVYQYYKGKEDLLFSAAHARLVEAIELLDEQLQGIRDPESKLSKMIWYGLRYNDLHRDYIRTLLFECRSNSRFYGSSAYDLLRKHAGILLGILREGAETGQFRRDIDMRVVRDVIYGVIDMTSIAVLATNEIDEGVKDFDDIMALVLAMIAQRDTQDEESKESRILAAAEEEFSNRGFSSAKIADVARKAQVAEGTIYEYFKNKEDLLMSVADKRIHEQLEALPELFDIRTPRRRLRRMVRHHFSLHVSNRNFLRLFVTEILLNLNFYQSKAYDSYRRYQEFIESVVREGKEAGTVRTDVNPRVFRNLFLGACIHMGIRWVILEGNVPYDKMQEIQELTDLLTLAVS
jgi:TetR/AcrR family transcriptional regulator, fatty acid metabolism regulator protein